MGGPGDHELRRHFDDHFLRQIPPDELVATIADMAADLREELVVTDETPLAARVQIGGVQIFATAAAFAELGLAGLVLAGSRPDTPMWTLARAGQTSTAPWFWKPATGSRRTASPSASPPPPFCDLSPTAVSVLMTQPTTTGSPYTAAAARLVLEPLQMSDSSLPARWPDTDPDAITGHNVTPEGAFVPEPARICSIPAAGGLWATAADLVRFGLRWSSLLPEALARKRSGRRPPEGPAEGSAAWAGSSTNQAASSEQPAAPSARPRPCSSASATTRRTSP